MESGDPRRTPNGTRQTGRSAATRIPHMSSAPAAPSPAADAGLDSEFRRGLGLFDATMMVIGSMIGSGIFIVSAEMGRFLGSPGWLLTAWLVTGALTVAAALSYGEL